jgi:ABC-2 type transport system permease protein
VRAELLKIRSTAWGRCLVALIVLGGTVVLTLAAAAPALIQLLIDLQRRYPHLRLTDAGEGRFDDVLARVTIIDAEYQRSLVDLVNPGPFAGFGSLGLATTCALLTGVLVATSDFRHGGIVLATLATPNRSVVVVRKAGAVVTVLAGAGLLLVLTSAGSLLTAVALTPDATLQLSLAEMTAVWTRSVLVLLLLGLMGLGAGLIVRHQTPAVAAVLVASVVEPTIVLVATLAAGSTPWAVSVLPLAASQLAPRGSTLASTMDLGAAAHPLMALAALVLWATLHMVGGLWRTVRTDLV